MWRQISSIIGLIVSGAMLLPLNNAVTNLHGHTTRAAIYGTIFIVGLVVAWTSVSSPSIQQVQQKKIISKQTKNKRSGWAIASICLGIVSLIPAIGFILGILAVVFGFISFSQIKKNKLEGKGLAITGIILGFVGIAISLILVFSFLIGVRGSV